MYQPVQKENVVLESKKACIFPHFLLEVFISELDKKIEIFIFKLGKKIGSDPVSSQSKSTCAQLSASFTSEPQPLGRTSEQSKKPVEECLLSLFRLIISELMIVPCDI